MEWKGNTISRGMWNDTTISSTVTKSDGNNTGAYLVFNESAVLYVGISYVSIENAKENLFKETNLDTFDAVLDRSK